MGFTWYSEGRKASIKPADAMVTIAAAKTKPWASSCIFSRGSTGDLRRNQNRVNNFFCFVRFA